MKKQQLLNEIELKEKVSRSTWRRAVCQDAYVLIKDSTLNEFTLINNDLELILLNGANNWSHYSWSGCGLCYNEDIAKHYCTPSELKRSNYGNRRPNKNEEWLDVQARALRQAWWLIRCIIKQEERNACYE